MLKSKERWPSGLRHRLAKPTYVLEAYRGFESLSLRVKVLDKNIRFNLLKLDHAIATYNAITAKIGFLFLK